MRIIWQDSASTAYEDARIDRLFNYPYPERFPLAVVKVACEKDIIATIKLAIEHKCRVAVRSGGQSWAAWSVRNNLILIDLGDYKKLDVDAENRIARVTPSVTGQELNSVLVEEHGLMFPGGHCLNVGLGGFLLQGGIGWNCRNWGWACERVQAVDVVTAEGELLHCNAVQHQELYWAARASAVVEKAFTTLPHKKAFTFWYAMNPCSRRKLPDMALSMQSDHYLALYACWEQGSDDHRCQTWMRNVIKKLEKHSVGAYLGDADFQVRKSKFWTEDNTKQLMKIRQKWDPTGRICGYLDQGDQGDLTGSRGLDA